MKSRYTDADLDVLKRNMQTKEGILSGVRVAQFHFATSRSAIERLIPPPLKPVDPASATVYFSSVAESNFQCAWNEAALGVSVEYNGEVGNYWLAMPVTNDMAMAFGREVFGFPKKIAETITLDADDDGCDGVCIRRGETLLRGSMDFVDSVEHDELLNRLSEGRGSTSTEWIEGVSFNFKAFLGPRGTSFDDNPRLVRQITKSQLEGKALIGDNFGLEIRSSLHDDFGEIPINKVHFGYFGTFRTRMCAGDNLVQIPAEGYLAYSFSRYDHFPE